MFGSNTCICIFLSLVIRKKNTIFCIHIYTFYVSQCIFVYFSYHWIYMYCLFTFCFPLWLSFDLCAFRLNFTGNSEVCASGFCLDDECWRLKEQKVHNVLTEALGDRVKLVRVIWRNTPSEFNIENVWDYASILITQYNLFVTCCIDLVLNWPLATGFVYI